MTTVTKDNMFRSKPPAGTKKAADRGAHSIVDDEVALRDAKTARLRLARLAKEAADKEAAITAPVAPRAGRKRAP
ncbi:MAG: hypothetical protein K0R27_4735 [Xanthobacteraceae bacterium]|jgi:hypothetical protein|nr:hypothetical protein [Xanthobacteraceae bacterium]